VEFDCKVRPARVFFEVQIDATVARDAIVTESALNEALYQRLLCLIPPYLYLYILQDGNATPKTVRLRLLKEHEYWKMPERRVGKFVKRQKKASKTEFIADDDDVSVVSSVSRRAKSVAKGVGRMFGRNSKRKAKESAPATLPVPASLLGTITTEVADPHDDDPLDSLLTPFKEKSSTVFEEEGVETEARALIFEDDNDGKKQGGFCQPCEGCAIL